MPDNDHAAGASVSKEARPRELPPGPQTLVINDGDFRAIVAQALAEQPLECCGILAGETNGRVTRVFPTGNAAASAEEFVIDPEEQFAVLDAARGDGLQIIGVYHSHPETPARPSEHDIRMAYADDWAYLIVSLSGDEVQARAFRIVDGRPREIPVDVRSGPAGAAGLASRALHAGQEPDPTTGARAVPVHLTTSFVFPSAAEAAARFALESDGMIYSRLGNPTTAVLEERLAALEGGVAALATASGQAAEAIALLTLAGSGDNIVSSTSVYGGTYTLFLQTFARMGIEVRWVDIADTARVADLIDARTKAVYCETIGNPNLDIADIGSLASIAHDAGVPLVIDNTFAGPFVCRPLSLGADVVVESLTKYVGGHGTVIGGIIVDGGRFAWTADRFAAIAEPDPTYMGVRFAERFAPSGFVARARLSVMRDLGACLSPLNSFFFLQGVETLELRIERHCANARRVAEFLATDKRVERVHYPGLVGCPSHAAAAAQFTAGRFGGMVCFDLKGGRESGARFIDGLSLVSHLANLGDGKSLVVHPASTTHAQLTAEQQERCGIRPGFVRLSVGLETADDIIADLDQALDRA